MSGLHESVVSLRFFGDELDPDELTRLLGATPTVGVRKGGTWKTRTGTPKIARTGSWRLNTDDRSPGNLDAHIADLLAGLTSEIPVWRDLTARFRADVFCGLFMAEINEGVPLKPATLHAIGERGLILDLDIYAPPERES